MNDIHIIMSSIEEIAAYANAVDETNEEFAFSDARRTVRFLKGNEKLLGSALVTILEKYIDTHNQYVDIKRTNKKTIAKNEKTITSYSVEIQAAMTEIEMLQQRMSHEINDHQSKITYLSQLCNITSSTEDLYMAIVDKVNELLSSVKIEPEVDAELLKVLKSELSFHDRKNKDLLNNNTTLAKQLLSLTNEYASCRDDLTNRNFDLETEVGMVTANNRELISKINTQNRELKVLQDGNDYKKMYEEMEAKYQKIISSADL